MNSAQITCTRALTVLVGGSDEFASTTVNQARLHARRCPRCSSAYAAGLRPAALRMFETAPPQPPGSLRAAVFVVALTQLVLAIPWLFGRSFVPDAHVAVSHLTRDGAFGLIVASCGLATVWRSRYAHATMLIGLLVLGLQVVSGIADQQTGSVSASFELVHLPVVLIVLGLFAVAATTANRATPRAAPTPRTPRSPAVLVSVPNRFRSPRET